MDSKTSLPLSHSLLEFYRSKLRYLSQEIVKDLQLRIDGITFDAQTVHVLEGHLSNCEKDINTLTLENNVLRALSLELMEENARVRIDRGLVVPDKHTYDRIIHCLTERPHVHQDNSVILTSMIKRCQALESLAYKKCIMKVLKLLCVQG